MNNKLKAVLMGALLVGTGGVGAVALQAHAQDGQNSAATTATTTGSLSGSVSARPSIQTPAGGLGDDQDNDRDQNKGQEVSDDSRQVDISASVNAIVGNDQNEQDGHGDRGEQDSGNDD